MNSLAAALVLVLAAASPSPSPSPSASLAPLTIELDPEMEADVLKVRQKRMAEELAAKDVLEASAAASVAEELPRLKAAAEKTPNPDTLLAYARALMACRKFLEAQAAAHHAAALAPSHAEAALAAEHLRRFDGTNGDAVVAGLEAARRERERQAEVAEARRTLPELAARAGREPTVENLLEHAAARVVLEEWAPAREAANKALAADPKSAPAKMLVEELAKTDRPGEVIRQRITFRWAGILTGKDPLGR